MCRTLYADLPLVAVPRRRFNRSAVQIPIPPQRQRHAVGCGRPNPERHPHIGQLLPDPDIAGRQKMKPPGRGIKRIQRKNIRYHAQITHYRCAQCVQMGLTDFHAAQGWMGGQGTVNLKPDHPDIARGRLPNRAQRHIAIAAGCGVKRLTAPADGQPLHGWRPNRHTGSVKKRERRSRVAIGRQQNVVMDRARGTNNFRLCRCLSRLRPQWRSQRRQNQSPDDRQTKIENNRTKRSSEQPKGPLHSAAASL